MMTCNAVSYSGREPYIFFSFYKNDAPIVYPIIERLALEGYRICYDDGSKKERKDVLKQLLKSSVCITAISEEASNDHDFCEDMSFALQAKNGSYSLMLADFPLRPSLKLYLENTCCINAFDCADEERVYKRFFEEKNFDGCRDAGVRPDHGQLAAWRERAKEYILDRSKAIYDTYGEDSVYIQNWYNKPDRDLRDAAAEEAERRGAEEERLLKLEEERRAKDEAERLAKEEEYRRRAEEERLRKLEEEHLRLEKEQLIKELQEKQKLLESIERQEKEKTRAEEEARRREEEEKAERERKEQEKAKQDELERLRKENKRLEELIMQKKQQPPTPAAEPIQTGEDDIDEEPDEKTLPVPPSPSDPQDDDRGTILKDGIPKDDATVMKAHTRAAMLIRLSTGAQYQIDRLENRIGRSESQVNVLVSGNSGISRVHAQIFQLDGHFKLQDLGSTFGTGLNGQDLGKDEVVDLPQTALIRLADEEFVFLSGADKALAETDGRIFLLRAVRTGEVRMLTEGSLPLDRNHPWQNGVLKDRGISRAQHAELIREGNECHIRALKSTNGTYLNGRRMGEREELPLRHGDKVSLGSAEDFEYLETKIK